MSNTYIFKYVLKEGMRMSSMGGFNRKDYNKSQQQIFDVPKDFPTIHFHKNNNKSITCSQSSTTQEFCELIFIGMNFFSTFASFEICYDISPTFW